MIVNKYTNGGGGGYVLPTATDSRLGGIKVGSGLTIDSGGTLSTSGGTGVSDYNDLTGKPVVNGFELSGSTFPIWAGRDLKECFGLMDESPYGSMPSYTGHKVIVPEGEYRTGNKTGSTILVEYAVVYDEQTHYQDCGTITSDRNGTVRTISFQVEYNQSENYWKLQYKSDTAETWTDFDSLTPNEVGWAQLYSSSWATQQYTSYARIHTDDSYMGRIVFDFVPDYTSNWDLGKYATWTLPQDAVHSEIVATGIRRSKWRSTKIYVKYDKNQNFIEGCYDTEKYYIFVTSAGTVTSSTLTDYEKLEGYQDISGHTTFYDSETKHKWGVGVLDGNGKVYSTANLMFYCDFNGGYQTTTPSLEGYVNVNVNGTMTTYHGKWQKQSYGSWQTLLWEPVSEGGSGLAVYDYDSISGDASTRAELIAIVSGGTPAVVTKDGMMYYYRGYDEGEFKYVFVDYKNVILPEQPQHSNRFHFRAIKVDVNQAYQDWFEQDIAFNIQQWMYTTSYYYKQSVSTNGFLYASDNTYDVIPGSTPKVGETYTIIYFTIPGMNWVSNGLTVTVNGDSHEISWWGGKEWNVDGNVYGEDHTTEAGMTVDFSHIDETGHGYIGISAAAMTVTQVPENGEGGGTSVVPPVLANYNLQMYRSGEWHSICGVPNLIFSGASQGILASAVSTVKAGLYNGAYAGTDTFYILVGDLSQEAQSIVYTANTGVSETVTLKSTDYTAVIVRTISGDTYSLTLTKNPSLWIGTQQEYDLLPSYDNNTLYVIR